MFSLGIHYLNGWAMATHPSSRERAEWPPHPDRVFMALVAASMETDGGEDEAAALEWLETLGPPTIFHSAATDRTPVTTFVPINDERSPMKKGKALMPSGSMPIGRDRQPRQFPLALPETPFVHLLWKDAAPPHDVATALGGLAAKVTSVGHSASLVQMWVSQEEPKTLEPKLRELVPRESGAQHRLRVFGPGRLRHLRDRFATGLRPTPSLWEGYGPPPQAVSRDPWPHSHFRSDLLILRQRKGRKFGIESTLILTEALRGAVMSGCPMQPPPEWISGHQPDGRPSQRERGHIAFLPLPFVGRKHATGHLLGLALAVPEDIPDAEQAACFAPLFFNLDPETGEYKPFKLWVGKFGEMELQVDEGSEERQALRSETWTRPAKRWATVTPIALDRHAKSSQGTDEIAASIADGCVRVGLPRPIDVIPTAVSLFEGVPVNRDMPRIRRRRDDGLIRQTHAIMTFPSEVVGPVLVGAGRYRGYGFCRPLPEEHEL